ncbi:DUF4145 domain-containing protein [Sphingomonas sp. S2M10]|uniref:DUF4145 domain-containing protein n=1 Tax=Sphingomonas sp. S2M10 TaxID=2705010 RepID=UPI001B3B26E5|nr:DUF4145 domain-containing protein [Sphingomonas sp. S2M10]
MPEIMSNCPRCQTKQVSLEIKGDVLVETGFQYSDHEVLAKCRICGRTSIFSMRHNHSRGTVLYNHDGAITAYKGGADQLYIRSVVTIFDASPPLPPPNVPREIEVIFNEGALAFVYGCFNAAGAMFRLVLDLTSKTLLPDVNSNEDQPNAKQRNNLFDRLGWLFDSGKLPKDLRAIADCVRQDGNDAAHDGSLAKIDAEDLLDFTAAMLSRVFTEPARIAAAEARRKARRES